MGDIYAPPNADLGAPGFAGAAVGRFGSITEDVVMTLETSSRWMGHSARFGYLLAVVYGLLSIAVLGALAPQFEEIGGGGSVFGFFLIYALMAAIVFMVSHHLRGASMSAKLIRDSGNPSMMLADTIQHQAYVWKVTGILSLIGLVIFFLSILALVGGLLTSLVN